jgi:hypothetical protein
MDVVRLGPAYNTAYIPDELVEGYSSCIWTERFAAPGEFEIKTPHINAMRTLLPEDTLISHLDTREVMMVENHVIEVNDEGVPELVITGRDLKTWLEHRYVESKYQKKRKMRRNYTAVDGLAVLAWQAFVNGTGKDVTRGDPNPWDDTDASDTDYPWTTYDVLPNVVITDSVPVDGSGVAKRWWLTEGLLGPQFWVFMNKYKLGIRALRPQQGAGSKQVITVDHTPLADRGKVSKVSTDISVKMAFDLYKGLNRSEDQSTNPVVSFSTLQGDLGSPQYLWSKKDYKTVIEIISGVGIGDQTRPGEGALTGWKRKVDQLDAGTPDIPTEPERPKDPRKNATNAEVNAWKDDIDAWKIKHGKWVTRKNSIISEFTADVKDDASNLLDLRRPVRVMTGDISTLTPFQYKVHYDLGDKVTTHGDYGMVENMIVSEYIRTDDQDGDRGYPGLIAP